MRAQKIIVSAICVSANLLISLFSFSQNISINTDGTVAETGVMLDVKGKNDKATTATQNIFQIKSNDASLQLKLRLILGTNATATSMYGAIEVADSTGAGTVAYRYLSLQPNGGKVGIGTTIAASQLSNNSTNTNDAVTWGQGTTALNWYQNSQGYIGVFYNANTTVGGNGILIKGAGNTTNPLLSVDYGGVQSTAGTALFRVLGNGNVGIGTTNPTAKLEVVGTPSVTIKIVDGNQAAGKVLTSDATGQGSWQTFSAGCMAQYVQEFTANGTWIPTGSTAVVDIEMWGGGGGGGGGMTGSGADNKGGAGGGSGAYIRINNVKVVAGSTYNITVGALGGGGAVNGNGTAGTASSFVGPASVPNIVAAGGPAGTRPACPVGGGLYSTGGNNVAGTMATSGLYSMAAGGGGGSCGCAGACINAFAGASIPAFGTGGGAGTGVNSGGGGGGGGAGRLNGGIGGNGSAAGAATAGTAAAANSAAGGGGGGGSATGTAAAGGAGGAGYVKIIYWQ